MTKDHVQVHNRYEHLDDSEEKSVWNLPPDDLPSAMDESPSETRIEQICKERSAERIPTEEKLFPDLTRMMAPIMQWNCRGLKVNFIDITLLLQAFLSVVFCLQYKS